MTTIFLPHSAMTAQQWEIAKGHLRAMVAIAGSCSTSESVRPYRFEKIGVCVEAFIAEFESFGYHEGSD